VVILDVAQAEDERQVLLGIVADDTSVREAGWEVCGS
jgi:hypothetical protein